MAASTACLPVVIPTVVRVADRSAWSRGSRCDGRRHLSGSSGRRVAETDRVTLVDGAWRVSDQGRSVAIHSRDPQREADQLVRGLLENRPDPQLLVVIGLGLGYILDGLERRQWPGKVVAIEPNPDTVAPLLARRDWQAWMSDDRLRLLVGPDYDGASDCWRLFGDGSQEPAVFVNPVFERLYRAEVGRARALLGRMRFNAKANADARRQHGARYLLNTLANLRTVSGEGDVAALTGAAPSLPAILVGAGPSLDSTLASLRDAQEKALIIAVDTALRPLLSAGIAPHLVVAVDPAEANVRHLCDLPPAPDTFLVAEASVDPAAFEHFRRRTFLFSVSDHQPWPWLNAHGQGRGRLRAWGSVLTSAFDLALLMGCDPVVFAGADLAFTGERLYCRGVVYEQDWRRLQEWGVGLELQWVQQLERWPRLDKPGIAGNPVRTAEHLVAFRDWLVEQIGREPRRSFINATGAGILHGRGIRQASLDAIVASLRQQRQLPVDVVRGRYKPADGRVLLAAARKFATSIADEESTDNSTETLHAWATFADGLTRDRIAETLSHALTDVAHPDSVLDSEHRATDQFDGFWAEPLARNLPLVTMPIERTRIEPLGGALYCFRFRTTTARLIGCVLRMPEGAVTENGQPLKLAASVENIRFGEYFIWRDEVRFVSSDGSDPRHNYRPYTVLAPHCVAHVERLPLSEILERHL